MSGIWRHRLKLFIGLLAVALVVRVAWAWKGTSKILLDADPAPVAVGEAITLEGTLPAVGDPVPPEEQNRNGRTITFVQTNGSWGESGSTNASGEATVQHSSGDSGYAAGSPGQVKFQAKAERDGEGNYSTAWSDSDEVTVTVVGVDKLQYEDGENYVDVSGTLYVLVGTTVNFKAISTPSNAAWPSGKPTWGGSSGASGSGATKAVTFNTVSESTGDFKTVTVTCGNTVTANVVVFDITPTLFPVADFEDRSYTEFGLKEDILLDYTSTPSLSESQIGSLEWSIESGSGDLIDNDDGTGMFTVSTTPGVFTLAITRISGPGSGGSNAKRFQAGNGKGPTDIYNKDVPNSSIWHVKGKASVGFVAYTHFEPKDVSFGNLTFAEGGDAGDGEGCLAFKDDENHPHTPSWRGIMVPVKPEGSRVTRKDLIKTGEYDPPFQNGGTFKWTIPMYWSDKVVGTFRVHNDGNHFKDKDQDEVVTANGKCTASKAGLSHSKERNDDDSPLPDTE